jgi:hypothetical protein
MYMLCKLYIVIREIRWSISYQQQFCTAEHVILRTKNSLQQNVLVSQQTASVGGDVSELQRSPSGSNTNIHTKRS